MSFTERMLFFINQLTSSFRLQDKIVITIHNMFYTLCYPFNKISRMVSGRNIIPFENFPFEITVKNSDGIFVTRGKSDVDIVSENFEKPLRDIFKSFDQGTFVDVGSNIGKYSIMISKQLSGKDKIVSIEANRKNFITLKRNLDLNGCKNVIPVEIACWNKKYKLKLYDHDKPGKFSLTEKSKIFLHVDADKLDNIIKKLNVTNIGLVKIDVEGAEPNVLDGMHNILKKDRPRIIFESWNKKHFNDCKSILSKYGYNLYQLEKYAWIATQK